MKIKVISEWRSVKSNERSKSTEEKEGGEKESNEETNEINVHSRKYANAFDQHERTLAPRFSF
jgi:hypothetical protein